MEWDINGLVMHMNKRRFSIDSILLVIFAGLVLFFGYRFYLASSIETLRTLCFLFLILMVFMVFILYMVFRKLFLKYSEVVCNHVDALAMGKIPEQSTDEDTLTSKIQTKLDKLSDITYSNLSQQAQQKQEIQQIVSDISHQLKTPLTSINIMLDNILDNPNMDEDTKEKFIQSIKREVTNISNLATEILKLSKFDANVVRFENKEVLVKDIIKKAISNVEMMAEIKNVEIKVVFHDNVKLVCDLNWQVEAIINILKNCIEHSSENSFINIEVIDNKIYKEIIIKDSGEGIDKKDLLHIFERFYKGKNSSKDSVGIGLALAKKIIEMNNGSISVNSVKGKGTIFTIRYY